MDSAFQNGSNIIWLANVSRFARTKKMMMVESKNSKSIHILLWIAQWLLAATFIWAGFMKLISPEQLPFPWIKENPVLVAIAGIVDLLGGIGIVFPMLLNIKPKLTIYAAYGIILLMIVASVFHVLRGEANDIGFNVFVLVVALFVAWGRGKNS